LLLLAEHSSIGLAPQRIAGIRISRAVSDQPGPASLLELFARWFAEMHYFGR
jgi:hypothetical protein